MTIVAAELNGKEKHNSGWSEQRETEEVEFWKDFVEEGEGESRFYCEVGDVDKEKENGYEGADWKVYKEA